MVPRHPVSTANGTTLPIDRHRRPRSIGARVALLGAVAIAPVVVVACAPEPDAEATTCAEIVNQAVYQTEIEDEVNDFDRAIQTCGSFDELAGEIDRYDGVTGYPVAEFLARRCTENAETLATTEVCLVAAPPTTITANSTDVAYVGRTLDGREVIVTPADVEFSGKDPKQIAQTVATAERGGAGACIAVLDIRDNMARLATSKSKQGDIASMYALHAQRVADFIGCASIPIPLGPDGLPVFEETGASLPDDGTNPAADDGG